MNNDNSKTHLLERRFYGTTRTPSCGRHEKPCGGRKRPNNPTCRREKVAALANPVSCGNNSPAQFETAPTTFFREWALRRRWIMKIIHRQRFTGGGGGYGWYQIFFDLSP